MTKPIGYYTSFELPVTVQDFIESLTWAEKNQLGAALVTVANDEYRDQLLDERLNIKLSETA
jgi:hypothetical protein